MGRSHALTLARAGAKVVVSSRKADVCDAVVEEMRAAGREAVKKYFNMKGTCDEILNILKEK